MAARIVDAADGDSPTLYSRAEVRIVTFDSSTQRSRPLLPGERAGLEGVLET